MMSVTDGQSVGNGLVINNTIRLSYNSPTSEFNSVKHEVSTQSLPACYQHVDNGLRQSQSVWNAWNCDDGHQRLAIADEEKIDTVIANDGGPTLTAWNEGDEDTDETCSIYDENECGHHEEVNEHGEDFGKYDNEIKVYYEDHKVEVNNYEQTKTVNDGLLYVSADYQPVYETSSASFPVKQLPPSYTAGYKYKIGVDQSINLIGNNDCSGDTASTAFYDSGSDADMFYYLPPDSKTNINVYQNDRKQTDDDRSFTNVWWNSGFFEPQLAAGEGSGFDYHQSTTVDQTSDGYFTEPDAKRFKVSVDENVARVDRNTGVQWMSSQGPYYGHSEGYEFHAASRPSNIIGHVYSFDVQHQPQPIANSTMSDWHPWSAEVHSQHHQEQKPLQQQVIKSQKLHQQPADYSVRNCMLDDYDGAPAGSVASSAAAASTATDWNHLQQLQPRLFPNFNYNSTLYNAPLSSTAAAYSGYSSSCDVIAADYRCNPSAYPGTYETCMGTYGVGLPLGVGSWTPYGNAWGVPSSSDVIRNSMAYGGGGAVGYGGGVGSDGEIAIAVPTSAVVPSAGPTTNDTGLSKTDEVMHRSASASRFFSAGIQNTHATDIYNASYHWKPSLSSSAASSVVQRTMPTIPVDGFNTPRSSSYKSPLQTTDSTLSSSSQSTAHVRSYVNDSLPLSSTSVESASIHRAIGTLAGYPLLLDQLEPKLSPSSSVYQRSYIVDHRRNFVETPTDLYSSVGNVDYDSRPWSVVLQDLPVRAGQRDYEPKSTFVTAPPVSQRSSEVGIRKTASEISAAAAAGDVTRYVAMMPAIQSGPSVPSAAMASAQPAATVAGFPCVYDVRIKLCDMDLWKQFHACVNEMIITKSGRRLFPALRFSVLGLRPTNIYMIFVDVMQVSASQWKYQSPQWVQTDKETPEQNLKRSRFHTDKETLSVKRNRVYGHPDGAQPGSHWMSKPIVFSRLKLTNDAFCLDDTMIRLQSMHRYILRISVAEVAFREPASVITRQVYSHVFKETEFIAVTAYQNTDITQLKIDNNPFAKGFRDEANSVLSQGRSEASPKGA